MFTICELIQEEQNVTDQLELSAAPYGSTQTAKMPEELWLGFRINLVSQEMYKYRFWGHSQPILTHVCVCLSVWNPMSSH